MSTDTLQLPRYLSTQPRVAEYASASLMDKGLIMDVHKEMKSKNIERAHESLIVTSPVMESGREKLDIENWLPFAAKQYKISPDINDYFFVPVITIPSDLPNRNGAAFPLKELVKFQPEYGVQSYKTFKGKPVQYEHKNKSIEDAYGVIADTYLRKMEGYGGRKVWKLIELLAIDRTKYIEVATRVATGQVNSYSMGCWVGYYTCSYCGARLGDCSHIRPKDPLTFYELNDKLVFRNCHDNVGFETSIVETPAFSIAASDKLIFM